jgi:hypothetical protein
MRRRGAALLAALAFSVITGMIIGTCLLVSSTNYSLSWTQSRSEGALLLAEAGINDELTYIAQNVNASTVAGMSSQPTVLSGETLKYPGESHAVYGRKGTVRSLPEGNFWVCSTNNRWWKTGATPVPWDGRSSTIWITATGYVNGSWRRVEVQGSTASIFGLYAVYATSSYANNSKAINLAAADVTINGVAGTNGLVDTNNGSTFLASGLLNANTVAHSSGQFDSTRAMPGAPIYSQAAPIVYPTTVSILKRTMGITSYGDAAAWAYLTTHNNNSTQVYTYRSGASSATLSTANCTRLSFSGTTLTNGRTGSAWSSAAVKPGTSSKVKTVIFEPGDYYFSSVSLDYDATTELVIDPQALASGGTPGQVRFWIYDPSGKTDNIDIPMVATKPTGATIADPAGFRIYYGTDGGVFTFNRPVNAKDWTGTSLADFNVFGGVYAITKLPGDTSSLTGTEIDFQGATGNNGGRVILNGSLLADKIFFHGPGTVTYVPSTAPADPPAGAGIQGGYDDGL